MTSWRARDIPDLTGRRAIVTGANSGLGFQTALELARHGAAVLMTSRRRDAGDDAVRRVRDAAPNAKVSCGLLDLADLGSVRQFADANSAPIDILVNNAGVMAIPRRLTADGFEMQLGTNHLGHFALTGLLLPDLLARPGARVVTVSSSMHRAGAMNFDDLMGEQSYRPWQAYSQSKLANLLFMRELDRRVRKAGFDLVSVGRASRLCGDQPAVGGAADGRAPADGCGHARGNTGLGAECRQRRIASAVRGNSARSRGRRLLRSTWRRGAARVAEEGLDERQRPRRRRGPAALGAVEGTDEGAVHRSRLTVHPRSLAKAS
jgi:NAD(P)-dependent dehydrogenase (short-subunit alcohol dehydrogenase family)